MSAPRHENLFADIVFPEPKNLYDDYVGRLLKCLEKTGELDNAIIMYTSDQGFFMGEHDLMDKRLMYEESLRMPTLIHYPKEIKAGSKNTDMIMNIDFTPTFLDYAGIKRPDTLRLIILHLINY